MAERKSATSRRSTAAASAEPAAAAAAAAREQERERALERTYVATQWQLAWRKFRRHRSAIIGGLLLLIFYLIGLFAEFFAPYVPTHRRADFPHAPPQRVRFVDGDGRFHVQPFVLGFQRSIDRNTLRRIYQPDTAQRHRLRLFARGDQYRLWGLIPARIHLFGSDDGPVFLLGTDNLGRDLLSRIIYASRISLSVGLVGVTISFVLGVILGGVSGYFGGAPDMAIQRLIEFLLSVPRIPLWMALSAALPRDWTPLQIYFAITIVLSIVGWAGLARVVRGKLLELRELDFVMAARIAGDSSAQIIRRHLVPSFLSYLIVHLTLAVPQMILSETALSFLGLGLRPPIISWGTLLRAAQNMRTVALYPWLLIPGLFVVVAVLSFNFLGDGMRDAADPYK